VQWNFLRVLLGQNIALRNRDMIPQSAICSCRDLTTPKHSKRWSLLGQITQIPIYQNISHQDLSYSPTSRYFYFCSTSFSTIISTSIHCFFSRSVLAESPRSLYWKLSANANF
jgi:hypothetical protein